MSSCDILFANTDINEKFFCDEVTRDLKLNTLFDDDVIGVLSVKVSASTIKARQEIFKFLDNESFYASLMELKRVLFESQHAKTIVENCSSVVSKMLAFLSYIESFSELIYWECDFSCFFLDRIKETLKCLRSKYRIIKDEVVEYKMLCDLLNDLVLQKHGDSFNVSKAKNIETIIDKLQYLSSCMGYDIHLTSDLKQSININNTLSRAIMAKLKR